MGEGDLGGVACQTLQLPSYSRSEGLLDAGHVEAPEAQGLLFAGSPFCDQEQVISAAFGDAPSACCSGPPDLLSGIYNALEDLSQWWSVGVAHRSSLEFSLLQNKGRRLPFTALQVSQSTPFM